MDALEQLVSCVDIRDALRLLGLSAKTLRRAEGLGKIEFVRDGGYRYLPLDRPEDARIALRRPGERAAMLGTTDQTVRQWMADIPEGTSPERMEEPLLERKAQKRKLRK